MTSSEIASAERAIHLVVHITDEVRNYVKYLKAKNKEALAAVDEIARRRADLMLRPFDLRFTSDYDNFHFRETQYLEMRPKSVACRFIHERPMDKSPAIVVDHVIDRLKNGISEQFARLLIRNWSDTQRYA